MKGRTPHPHRRITSIMLVAGLALTVSPGMANAAHPVDLPECPSISPADLADGVVVSPWEVLLDKGGAVSGHRMKLRHGGVETTLRTGRRGFFQQLRSGRVLVGDRTDHGTTLTVLDTTRGCRVWTRGLDRLAYPLEASREGPLRMSIHYPGTRGYEGTLLLDPESGATDAMIDGECASVCEPNDGEVPPAAFAPAGAARPVPNFAGGGWPRDRTLGFRWGSGAVPPQWARGPLKSAASDAVRTAASRSPHFGYASGASDSVRYTGSMPTFCSGIACASRVVPTTWGVWLRPHGTDFAWGTLRWCQKKAASSCFDIRRVMLHELGHVAGLHHPESSGFRLGAHESVMHAITPAKPQPGSTRHAFGRCDVATLQELYDVPDNRTAISSCNDVASKLTLVATKSSVAAGGSVKLKAQLLIPDRSAYRQLAGNPLNGRSVKLKYRRAGSSAPWNTVWMKAQGSLGRYESTITPLASWEFKAAFPAPTDEGLRYSRSEIVKVKVRG